MHTLFPQSIGQCENLPPGEKFDEISFMLSQEKLFEKTQNLKKISETENAAKKVFLCEIGNGITHALGFLAFIPCGILLIRNKTDSPLQLIGNIVYVLGVLGMFLSSSLLHFFYFVENNPKLKFIYKYLVTFDHINICLIIPSHYVRFCVSSFRNCYVGVIIVVMEYGIAALNLVVHLLSLWMTEVWLYISMGWLAVVLVPYIFWLIPFQGVIWLFSGGMSYTVGIIFYVIGRRFYWSHVVWHLFVIGGTYCIFIMIYFYDEYRPELIKKNFCYRDIV